MNRLIRIIGLAPSELSIDALIERLKVERVRVAASLDMFKLQPSRRIPTAKITQPKMSSRVAQKIIDACKAANISIEEFLETQRQLKGEQ